MKCGNAKKNEFLARNSKPEKSTVIFYRFHLDRSFAVCNKKNFKKSNLLLIFLYSHFNEVKNRFDC